MSDVKNPTVFVVDKDCAARDRLVARISSLGFAVEPLRSGEELLQRVDSRQTGCAVVEFREGGGARLALHNWLTEASCLLPVILIHARPTAETANDAAQREVFRVLTKPCRGDGLANAIQDAIEHDHSRRSRTQCRPDLPHRLQSLDERECQTLELILAGHPNKAIQHRLGLSRRTVERVRSSILAKTGFLSFVELSAAYGEAKAVERVQSLPLTAAGGALDEDIAQCISAVVSQLHAVGACPEMPAEARRHLRMAQALAAMALRGIRGIRTGRSLASLRQSK